MVFIRLVVFNIPFPQGYSFIPDNHGLGFEAGLLRSVKSCQAVPTILV